jgi:hypothetical protein
MIWVRHAKSMALSGVANLVSIGQKICIRQIPEDDLPSEGLPTCLSTGIALHRCIVIAVIIRKRFTSFTVNYNLKTVTVC